MGDGPKPVTEFYACLYERDNSLELWEFCDDPVKYLRPETDDTRVCGQGLVDNEKAVILSMDDDRIRSRLTEEGNPPARSNIVPVRLMK